MAFLLDTNVMWRRMVATDPAHDRVKAKVDGLLQAGETLYITPQNMVEFQALATRPLVANGLGLSPQQANDEAKAISALFPLLPEKEEIYVEWRSLMERYEVRGRQVYDARLVAVMFAYNLTHLLTMNADHFKQFAGITIVEP